MSDKKGRCLCGSVNYQLSAEPLLSRICWCRDCQRISANGTVNMMVASDTLTVHGAVSEYTRTADSGNQIRHRFCPNCGIQLFANSSARPQFTVVRAGTLDDPSSITPSMNIWTESAPCWANLNQALESVAKQPLPPQQAPKP